MNNQDQRDLCTIVENAIISYIIDDPYPSETISFNRNDIYKCIRTLLENRFHIYTQEGLIDALDDLIEAGQIESCSDGLGPYYRLIEGERLFLRLKVKRYEQERHKIAQILRKAAQLIDPKPLPFIRRNHDSSTKHQR